MDKEEIKRLNPMKDVIQRYGIKVNRAGFCRCPFHLGDREPSMKIYSDSFHCYGCGANGDIFTFVQKYLGCDFKTAYIELGGSYQKPRTIRELNEAEKRKRQAERERIQREAREKETKRVKDLICAELTIIREHIDHFEVFSEPWCALTNDINMLHDALMQITEGGDFESGVYPERLRRYIE